MFLRFAQTGSTRTIVASISVSRDLLYKSNPVLRDIQSVSQRTFTTNYDKPEPVRREINGCYENSVNQDIEKLKHKGYSLHTMDLKVITRRSFPEVRDSETLLDMTIDLYYMPESGPCRAVLLTSSALGLELNLKLINLMKGEHLTPEFLKAVEFDISKFTNVTKWLQKCKENMKYYATTNQAGIDSFKPHLANFKAQK